MNVGAPEALMLVVIFGAPVALVVWLVKRVNRGGPGRRKAG